MGIALFFYISYLSKLGENAMSKDKFHFGATSVMREVPPGQSAVIKFNGKLEEIDTEWGAKMKYPILLFSPSLLRIYF